MTDNYRLNDDHSVERVDDLFTWAHWYEHADRQVALTKGSGWYVSTVFLGVDHGYGSVPVLFETMTFDGPRDEAIERYHTWDEALAGHKREVEATIKAIAQVNALAKETGAKVT